MRARHYDPNPWRFLQHDPIATIDEKESNFSKSSCNCKNSRTIKLFRFCNHFLSMFTRVCLWVSKCFYRTPDTSMWPYTLATQPKMTQQEELNPIEKERQKRVLLPLLGVIANQKPWEYHNVVLLAHTKLEQLIHLANRTEVVIEWSSVSILSILAGSAGRKWNSYSIVGHDLVWAIREFALAELTVTKLQKL